MDAPPILLVDDLRFDEHRPRRTHPERPERLEAARQGLRSAIPDERLRLLAPALASAESLDRAHEASYVEALGAALGGGQGDLDPDTYYSSGSREAAWLAAGGATALAEGLLAGDRGSGIALLRPPGHHARPGQAMGFCLLNNVAVAAAAALARGAERVAIIDWDVHHGNGTQEIFYDDPRVLFVSLHQFPFYPGTGSVIEVGRGNAQGGTVNIPLPAGAGPASYGAAFRRIVLPLLRAFAPDLVLVSAGFDAHERDPLAAIDLDAATFAAMTSALVDNHARVGLILEGGYDLLALEESVAGVGRVLMGERVELPDERPLERAREPLEQALGVQHRFWPRAFDGLDL